VLRTLGSLALAACLAGAATPAATPTRVIPPGVTVGGVGLGGLSAERARDRLEVAYGRPLVVGGLQVSRSDVADIDVDRAIESAFGGRLSIRPAAGLDEVVAKLAKRFHRAPVAARVTGATSSGPTFTAAKDGAVLDQSRMASALLDAVANGSTRVHVFTRRVPAQRTVANFGPAIVITRGVNTLKLYDGHRLVRTFRVATGQAIYPTPAGVWRIMNKQRNPWWYPPTSSSWARGLKPVPPGPGNPLGTRWMGLDAAGVGIHGTDAPASIGYSASHGCIRMQVPEAEWLFEHVHVGTPVVIL
jgi:lipoprotein-anchoring transpeptidase ErfK/SrfK